MKYYPQLLAAIFRTFGGNSKPSCIALSGATQNPQPGEPGYGDAFELPGSLISPEMPAEAIEGIEEFPDAAHQIVSEARATCVFAFPPLISRYSYSRDWRDRYGRWELAEILAETLFGGQGQHLRNAVEGWYRRKTYSPG